MNEHVKETNKLTFQQTICAVMGQIKRLEKADNNNFGGYKFTSVDDFKDAIRPLMAEHGLYVHVNQHNFQMIEYEAADKQGNIRRHAVAQFDFDITLKHQTGCQEDAERMTVALPFTGAQTSGAARSYAIKEWIKSRFLASSGDQRDEVDLLEQSNSGMRLPKKDARPIYERLDKEINELEKGLDLAALDEWGETNAEEIRSMPQDWYMGLRAKFKKVREDLAAQQSLDSMSEEELDALAEKKG